MKILFIGDVHWSSSSSIIKSRGQHYTTRLENLINSVNWAEQLAENYKVDKVIYLGDFFDKPNLSAEEISALSELHMAQHCEHIFLVGNHESSLSSLDFSSTNFFSNRKSTYTIINSPHYDINKSNDSKFSILYLPYIKEENRKKSIRDYISEYDLKEYSDEFKNLLVVSHNDIKGIRYGVYKSETGFDLNDIERNCKFFINGHLHNGCFLNDKESILNLGNLTGQNFSEDALKYKHMVMILDTCDFSTQFFENPYAFNFYKFDIDNDFDIKQLYAIKTSQNIISIRGNNKFKYDIESFIKDNKNIIAYKLALYDDEKNITQDAEIEILSSLRVDHIQQFIEFIQDTLGTSEIVLNELGEIIK